MGFPLAAPPVSITRADMNRLNLGAERVLQNLRSVHRRWMERFFLRQLTPSEFMILSAIVARTFTWNKVLEVIPLAVLSDGMEEGDEGFRLDDQGLPYFAGTGLNRSTIRTALTGLLDHGLIDRFSLTSAGRDVFAYLPVSLRTLMYAMAADHRFQLTDVPLPFHRVADYRSEMERQFARQFGGE